MVDFDGDGHVDLVALGPSESVSGVWTRDEDGGWGGFEAFRSVPNIDFSDPSVRFVDLDGDGHADILLTENDALAWYRRDGTRGYVDGGRTRWPADERAGPRVVFTDATESVQLADMTGDGLSDIVRIRASSICYWPNLRPRRRHRRPRPHGAEQHASDRTHRQQADGPRCPHRTLYGPRDPRRCGKSASGERDPRELCTLYVQSVPGPIQWPGDIRPEIRDPDAQSNQVGHSLSAIALALMPETVNERVPASRLRSLREVLRADASASDEEVAIRIIIGHELYPDHGPLGLSPRTRAILALLSGGPSSPYEPDWYETGPSPGEAALLPLIDGFSRVTSSDVEAFRAAVARIVEQGADGTIDYDQLARDLQPIASRITAGDGNSVQDLTNSAVNYALGRLIDEGAFDDTQAVAEWIRRNEVWTERPSRG